MKHPQITEHDLRIDNSRCGAVHVLCNISRTKIATTSCDSSNEWYYDEFRIKENTNLEPIFLLLFF